MVPIAVCSLKRALLLLFAVAPGTFVLADGNELAEEAEGVLDEDTI
jgi:hypothetical protein